MTSSQLLSRTSRHRRAAVQLALAAGAVVMLFPFYVMVRSAFTPEPNIVDGSLAPTHFTLENFRTAWEQNSWLEMYRSSILSTGIIFLLQIVTSVPAGYALARLKFRGSNAVFWTVIACFIIPLQVVAIPDYILLAQVGWVDTIAGLIAPSASSAFGIYLMRQFILTIPQSIFDAAQLDRVGPVAMVWRVVLPNVKPAIVALGVLSVIGHWNDLFWPNVILRTSHNATVPYGIAQFAVQETGTNWGPQMAAATLAVVPLVIAFVLCQRQFVNGISLSRRLN